MAGRSGGTPIRTGKVKPGYDQAFTLPKGTSAAPIKQVSTYGIKNKPFPKPTKKPSILKTMYPKGIKHDLKISAAIAIPTAAVLSKDAIIKDVKKGIKKVKGLFKKPKSDLGSSGDRKGYPHE